MNTSTIYSVNALSEDDLMNVTGGDGPTLGQIAANAALSSLASFAANVVLGPVGVIFVIGQGYANVGGTKIQ
jgi:hypothetical protein